MQLGLHTILNLKNNKNRKGFYMHNQTSITSPMSGAFSHFPELINRHQQVVGDNVAYFCDLVFRNFSVDGEHFGDVYDQLDSLYLANMSLGDKKALVSAYMQIECVLSAEHSMADKTIQVNHIHQKIDGIITQVVARFDDVSRQRFLFLSENLH